MGILGSLIYPHNAELAQELNEAEDKLRQTNNLHNDLVNSYRAIGEATKTFDSYLMSIMVMQYQLVYTQEDLSNLPDTQIPKLSQYWADRVESLALDGMGVLMAVDGFKAMYRGCANIVREGGIYRRLAGKVTELASKLKGEVTMTGLREPMLRSGNVSVMTAEGEEAGAMGAELAPQASAVSEALAEVEATGELADIGTAAESAGEAAKLAQEGSRLGRLASGAAAVLGPALLVLTVVMEILDAIHEGQEAKKLKEAADRIQGVQNDLDASVKTLKKVFTLLLNAAKTDIQTYNKLLPDLAAMEHAKGLDHDPFSADGIDSYIQGMDGITIQVSGITGYQVATLQNLKDATDFIRLHALHDAMMTNVITRIKTHMRDNNLTQMSNDDPYLVDVANVYDIPLSEVQTYNKFRAFVAEFASVLRPYHKQIQQDSTAGSIPKAPDTITPGTPDPSLDPKPDDLSIPVLNPAPTLKAA